MRGTRPGLMLGLVLSLAACGGPPAPPTPEPVDPVLGHRAAHTATPLLDGSVLVAGGCDVDGCTRATPSTMLLTASGPAATGALQQARDAHTAVALVDGRVLVAGGFGAEGMPPLTSTEVYDPAQRSWSSGPTLTVGRGGHVAARLRDDRVLVAGGWVGPQAYTASTEIIDTRSARVEPGPDLPQPVDGLAAATLPDGSILLTGGQARPGAASDRAVLVSPDGQSTQPVGPLREARFKHAMVTLPDGRVLVVGGTSDDTEILASTEFFDPSSNTFVAGPRLVHGRYKLGGAATLLPDGRVLVAGGGPGFEVIDPGRGVSASVGGNPTTVASFSTARVVADTVWVVGGYDRNITLTGMDSRIPLSSL